MARPENQPKTPLAARLRKVRKDNGDPDRSVFAEKLGISKNTIAFYERGERTPDANVLETYHKITHVDLNWLVCGGPLTNDVIPTVFKEEKSSIELETCIAGKHDKDADNSHVVSFDEQSEFVLQPSYPLLTEMLGDLIEDLYKNEQRNLSVKEFRENLQYALYLINERVDNPRDAEEIESVFPQIRVRLKRKLQSVTNNTNSEKSN